VLTKGRGAKGAAAVPEGRPRALGKKARLREHYEQKVVPALIQRFQYTSPMQVPRFRKIVVNMGLGEAMMEEMAYRDRTHKGQRIFVHKIPSLLEYKSPSTMETPEIVTYLVEDPDKNGPSCAKVMPPAALISSRPIW